MRQANGNTRRQNRTTRNNQLLSAAPDFAGLSPLEPRVLMSAAPVANDDTHTALNTGGAIIIAILANDTDPDGDALNPDNIVVTAGNAFGTLEIDYINGTLIYTPDAGFLGTETFTYIVSDMNGDFSNEASVTLHVVNQMPNPDPEPEPEPEPAPDDKDDLVFLAPTSHDLAKLTLRRSGDMLQIVNNRTGAVLLEHVLSDVNSLSISIEGRRAIQLTIDFASGGAFDLPDGVTFSGGNHRCEDDQLTFIGTSGSDMVAVDGSAISFSGLEVNAAGIERLEMKNGAGDDTLMLAGVVSFEQINIDDASGNDTYMLAATSARRLCGSPVRITDRAGDDTYDIDAGKYDISDNRGRNIFDYSDYERPSSQPFGRHLARFLHHASSIRYATLLRFFCGRH